MKICVDTDIHAFGAPFCGVDLFGPTDLDTYLHVDLGDNVEINNCRKKDKAKAMLKLKLYRERVQISVSSNHCLDEEGAPPPDYVIREIEGHKIMFLHGHLNSLWSTEKGRKYVHKNKPGCGWFKFQALKLLAKGRDLVPFKLKKEQATRFFDLSYDHSVDFIIAGHAHPKKVYERGTWLMVLPQGRHYLDITESGIEYLRSSK